MKNKIVRMLLVIVVTASMLTGCSNPIDSIKGMFNKDKEQEDVIDPGSLGDADEVVLTVQDNPTFTVGQTVLPADVVLTSPTDKQIDVMMYMTEDGTQNEYIDTSVEGTVSGAIGVWYSDGSNDTVPFMYTVTAVSEEDAEVESKPELPLDWEAAIKSGDYTMQKYTMSDGSRLSYLKPNVNIAGSGVQGDALYYNEQNDMAFIFGVYDSYENPYKKQIESTMSSTEIEVPATEEEFNSKVEAGEIEVPEGTTYDEYKQTVEGMGSLSDRIVKINSKQTSAGEFNVIVEETSTDYTSMITDIKPTYSGTTAYVNLPTGQVAFVDIYPLDTDVVDLDIDLQKALTGTEKITLDEDKLKEYNKVADKREAYKPITDSIIREVFTYVSVNDYDASSVTVDEPEMEDETSGSSGGLGLEGEITVTETETTTTTTTGSNGSSGAGGTYKQKYPSLFTWPDQQAIYGMEPKRLVYDLLSAKDTNTGEVKLEGCLVPIWGKKENAWISDMDFDLSSSNRQNATTKVDPVAPTGPSGIFGGGSSSNNNQNNSNDDEENQNDEEPVVATLSTSFGMFDVTSTSSLKVDEGKSTKSQVYVTDSKNNGYRILSTTQSSIESNVENCIYTIQDLQEGSWSAKRGAEEQISVGMITRYFMQWTSQDGETHTAEYMYTISTGNGFLMVIADKTPNTTSEIMYNICKMISSAE